MAYQSGKKGDMLEMTTIEPTDVNEIYASAATKSATIPKLERVLQNMDKKRGHEYTTSAIYNARQRILQEAPGMVMHKKDGEVGHWLGNDEYTKGNMWLEEELKKRHHLLD